MTDVLYQGEMAEKWYDPLFSPNDGSIEMIEKVLKGKGCKSILDVGCGTGRHAIKLAEKGYSVMGVDVSGDMIKRAKSKKTKATFQVMDMRKIKTSKKFDAVIVMDSAFCYMRTNDDCINALNSINKSLKKGGILIIEDVNTWSEICTGSLGTKYSEIESNGEVSMRVDGSLYVDPLEMVFKESRTYRSVGKNPSVVAKDEKPVELRIFTPNQMDLLFRLTGFKAVGFYGDMSLKPYSEDSHELFISVAKKA